MEFIQIKKKNTQKELKLWLGNVHQPLTFRKKLSIVFILKIYEFGLPDFLFV